MADRRDLPSFTPTINKMDKPIDPKTKRARRNRKVLTMLFILIPVIAIIAILSLFLLSGSINKENLRFATVSRGDLRSSVSATGKVVPAHEETVVSPLTTRIRELYVSPGDSVAAGTPLLRIDLENAETEYQRSADEAAIKKYDMRQADLATETNLAGLEMQIQAKEMAVERLYATYLNERRLDSIGSGTGERIREAELAWKTGRLELQQLRGQLANERKIAQAAASRRNLEGNISDRNLEMARKTLDEARLLAPISGTVTWLNTTLGATIAAGEKVAVVSDLTSFKILAELPEGHADKLSVGGPVSILAGGKEMEGKIMNINAQSNSGMMSFTVLLPPEKASELRPGVNAQVGVIYDDLTDVIRIPRGSFFNGPGKYDLYVKEGNRIVRRTLRLGAGDRNWIEVISGLTPGEEIVISDITDLTAPAYRL